MKRFNALCLLLLLCSSVGISQTSSYTVDGQSYELQTDVDGTLSLLWNIINQEYRYFAKKGTSIVELTNTLKNKEYKEEYKSQLQELTAGTTMNTDKVNLTLSSLRRFFNAYNKQVDVNYQDNSLLTHLEYRLGGFVGVTNSVFTVNPSNESNTQFGLEFELYDPVALPSHGVVVQYKQTLSSDSFDYTAAQFSLNHRFKFVKTSVIALYLNTKLMTITSSSRDTPIAITAADGTETTISGSGTNFQGPLIFGLGADIKLGSGFLTLNYHDAYSFVIDDNKEFPLDVSIGYKIIL